MGNLCLAPGTMRSSERRNAWRLCTFLLPLAALMVATGDVGSLHAAEDLVRPAKSPGSVEIVKQEIVETAKAGGDKDELVRSGRIVLATRTGIFRIDLGFKTELQSLRISVENVAACEGLSFAPRDGGGDSRTAYDLLSTPDVSVRFEGKTCQIEIGRKTTALLGAGGQLQFVDRYR